MIQNTQERYRNFLFLLFILSTFSVTAQIPTTVTYNYNAKQGAQAYCNFGCSYYNASASIVSVTQSAPTPATTKVNARYRFDHPGFINSQITKIVLEFRISKWSSFTQGPAIVRIKAPDSSCNDAISWISSFPDYEALYNCNNFGDLVYSQGFGTSENFATTYFLSIYDETSQAFPNQTLSSFDQNSDSITLSFTPVQGAMEIHDAKLIITYNDLSAPDAPVLAGNSNSTSSVNLSWNAISNASSYEIYSCNNQLLDTTTSNSCTFNNLVAGTTYQYKIKAVNINGSSDYSNCVSVTTLPEIINVPLRVLLQGAAIDPNTGQETLMRDNLRVAGLIPTTSPYSDGLTCSTSVFNAGSNDANDIVDWVWVELRNQNNNSNVVRSTSALLQRDGDIVATDGTSSLSFTAPSNNYYIAIKHRNHLGVMSSSAISLSSSSATVDFTNANSNISFGVHALTSIDMPSGTLGMWSGDVDGNGIVQYEGANSDTPSILSFVLNDPANFLNLQTHIVTGYNDFDINMDGNTQYVGGNADTPIILENILDHPGNFLNLNTYPINEQLP
jgi:hypothetical protein